MNLRPEQLAQHLGKTLLPMYWVAGDEPLLVQESTDLIRTHCRSLDFSEREQFFVEGNFNWQSVLQAGNSLSLFASRKIIELRLKSPKLDDAARNALQEFLATPNPDNLLLIISPKIESATTKTKWFQSLTEKGAVISIWPVDAQALPQWIQSRLQRHGLSAEREALALLADRVEGNLLAADQEIEKLALLLRPSSGAGDASAAGIPEIKGPIDARTIAQLVANSSRYNVFALIDATLAGQAGRAVKMLNGLAGDGSEPLMILAMLCKEIRSLIIMANRVAQGQNIAAVIQTERVWGNRKAYVSAALARLDVQTLQILLVHAQRVDQSVKGLLQSDPWRELTDLVLLLAGAEAAVSGARRASE